MYRRWFVFSGSLLSFPGEIGCCSDPATLSGSGIRVPLPGPAFLSPQIRLDFAAMGHDPRQWAHTAADPRVARLLQPHRTASDTAPDDSVFGRIGCRAPDCDARG